MRLQIRRPAGKLGGVWRPGVGTSKKFFSFDSGPVSAMSETLTPNKRATVSIMQAVELTGVSRRTLYNWMNESKVEFIRTAGGSRRIYTDTLFRNADMSPLTSVNEVHNATQG